jgi:CRISPR/Cas system-associated exonuclease Cas4 (RecB family)
LQRATNIHLLYETEGTQLGGGEKSRYITQLLYELPRYNNRISISEQVISLPPITGREQGIQFGKTAAVQQRLIEKAAKGFSPSALNTFIQCPLKFYFQEIAGIKETEDIEETIEARTLGEIIHHALFHLFKDFKGSALTPEKVSKLISLADTTVESAYSEIYPEGDIRQGKNMLIFEVSKLMVHQFLRHQIKEIREIQNTGEQWSILHLEEFIRIDEKINVDGKDLSVSMHGKADRIDRIGSRIRVIDYKTGSIYPTELKIKNWDDLVNNPKHGKAFQLMLYAYLCHKDKQADPAMIESGNVSLKSPSKGFLKVHLPDDQPMSRESMGTFQDQLIDLLEKIYNPNTIFTQTGDAEQCSYCQFKGICNR